MKNIQTDLPKRFFECDLSDSKNLNGIQYGVTNGKVYKHKIGDNKYNCLCAIQDYELFSEDEDFILSNPSCTRHVVTTNNPYYVGPKNAKDSNIAWMGQEKVCYKGGAEEVGGFGQYIEKFVEV